MSGTRWSAPATCLVMGKHRRATTLARAGGLCVSGVAYDQVWKILPLEFTDLGAQIVKKHRGAHLRL
jgi:hypothetical protein